MYYVRYDSVLLLFFPNSKHRLVSCSISTFRISFWSLIVAMSVVSGGFFLHDNTREFLNSTVQTTLDGSVPLSEVFFPSVVVCNINQVSFEKKNM